MPSGDQAKWNSNGADTNSQDTGWTPMLQEFDPDAEFEVHSRDLPHWRQSGATYFVTFRLADSLPQEKLQRLRAERLEWVRTRPSPISRAHLRRFQALFSAKVEQYLQAGYGACWLKRPAVASLAEQAMLHFHGRRYDLGQYVIMPNHVHVLVTPALREDLSKILHSWKSFTANAINRLLHRDGKLWQDESFDHIVRNEEGLRHYQHYIADNPADAGLEQDEYRVGCGRAV